MKLLQWSLWICSTVVFAVSTPARADLPFHALRSTEDIASALHAGPPGPAEAGAARAAPSWSGARTPMGAVLHAERVRGHALELRTVRTTAPVHVPDLARIALGFLADHSLAPPLFA